MLLYYCSNTSFLPIQGNSSCQVNNGGCSHICLLSPTGSECACPSHLALKDDGKTCHSGKQWKTTGVLALHQFFVLWRCGGVIDRGISNPTTSNAVKSWDYLKLWDFKYIYHNKPKMFFFLRFPEIFTFCRRQSRGITYSVLGWFLLGARSRPNYATFQNLAASRSWHGHKRQEDLLDRRHS